MAALGAHNPTNRIVQRRPLKNSLESRVQLHHTTPNPKAKILFVGQSKKRDRIKIATTTSFCKTASPALAGRAELIFLSKRNGRRFAPPANSSGKKKKVLFWSIFTTTLELILSKIPEQRKPPRRCSLTLATKQNTLYDF